MSNSISPFQNDYFFQNNSFPIVVFDIDSNIICVNKSVTKLFRYLSSEMVGKNITEFSKKGEFALEVDKIGELIKGKLSHYEVERKYISKTKQDLFLKIDISLIRKDQAEGFYFAGSMTEIKQLTLKSEQDLKIDKLTVALKKSPLIQRIRDVKKDTVLFEINNLLDYLGFKQSDYNNKNKNEFALSKIIDKDRYLEQSKIGDNIFEYSILGKNDTIYWFLRNSTILDLDEDNNPIQVYEYCIDITNQKKSEETIVKQEAFLHKISTAVPQFIYVINYLTNAMEFGNSRCKSVLGYTDLAFSKLEFDKIVHPDFKKEMDAFFLKVKAKKYNSHISIDTKLNHKTKGYRWYRIEKKVFERDENNNMIKSLGIISDIHSKKTNEEKIIAQQKLIEKVTSLMPAFSYIRDIDLSKSIYNNKKSFALLGYTPNEFFSMKDDEIIHPDSLLLHKELYAKIAKSKHKKNYGIDLLLKHKTKGYKWYKHRVTIFERNLDLTPSKMLKSIEDINEQKLNIIQIKEQKLFIEAITEKMPFDIYVSNLITGDVLFSNVKKINILGYTNEEYQRDILKIIHPNDLDKLIAFAKEIKTNNLKDNFELEFLLKHKTKGYRWYRTKSNPFKRNEQNEITHFVEILEDIHLEKIKTLKINDQNVLLDKIIHSTTTYLNVINVLNGEFVFTNFESRKILGYSKEEYKKLKCGIVHPDFKKELDEKLVTLVSNNNINNINFEFKIKHKTEVYKWVKLKLSVLKRAKNGEIVEILEFLEDIDLERKRTNKLIEHEIFVLAVTTNLPSTISIVQIVNQKLVYSNTIDKNVMGYTDRYWHVNNKELIPEKFHAEINKNQLALYDNKNNDTIEEEVLIKHKSKGYRWYRIKTKIFKRDEKLVPTQVLEIIEDIHKSKTNVIKVNQQRVLLHSITNSINSYIYLYNTDKKEYIFTNFSDREILGYSKDYFLKNSPRLIHSNYSKQLASYHDAINPSSTNKSPLNEFETEILFKHANNNFIWVKVIIKILKRNAKGEAVEILEIIEDINESKQKNLKIIDQEKFISNVSESIPQYLSVYELETGNCIYTNYENELIFGYTKDEYLSKSNTIVHPDFKEKTINLGKKMNVETFLDDVYSIDFPLKHKTLGYKWVRLKVVITERGENGKPIQALETIENIDDNKKVFLKVDEQQKFIQEVASIIPNLILITNLENDKLIYSNFGDRIYLDYTEVEWIEKGRSIIHPDHEKEYYNSINSLLKKGQDKTVNLDIQLKNRNGIYIWVSITTRVFKYDDNGLPSQTMSTFTDINDSKLAFNKIFEQQTFIHHISNSIPQYLSVWNIKSSDCYYTNFEDRLVFGYTKTDYVKNSFDYMHPDYRGRINQLGRDIKAKNSSDVHSAEFLLKHKSGGLIWVHLKIVVIERDTKGYAVQTLEIIEDINENKLSFNKINEQQNFIQKINGSIPSIIQVIDIEKKDTIYNNFENRIFLGYNKGEWGKLGTSIINPIHFEEFLKEFAKLKRGSNVTEIIKEGLLKDKKNKWVWVQFKIRPFLFDDEGNPIQILAILSDINERKELYIKLEKSQIQQDKQVIRLEEQLSKNIELERFASIASHDLKEPLRTIRNYAQILNITNRENLDSEGKQLIDHIENSTMRMSLLVKDILKFSKIGTSGGVFALVNIKDAITIVLEDLTELINKKEIEIILKGELPVLNADQNQIRQVFQNLISNAIKFSILESSKVIIEVEKKESFYLFSVKDNGIGIPKAELKNIFGIFRTLHNKREFEGQGIGLSICKRIIERHEGEIWVESELGFGACFYFTLPI